MVRNWHKIVLQELKICFSLLFSLLLKVVYKLEVVATLRVHIELHLDILARNIPSEILNNQGWSWYGGIRPLKNSDLLNWIILVPSLMLYDVLHLDLFAWTNNVRLLSSNLELC